MRRPVRAAPVKKRQAPQQVKGMCKAFNLNPDRKEGLGPVRPSKVPVMRKGWKTIALPGGCRIVTGQKHRREPMAPCQTATSKGGWQKKEPTPARALAENVREGWPKKIQPPGQRPNAMIPVEWLKILMPSLLQLSSRA